MASSLDGPFRLPQCHPAIPVGTDPIELEWPDELPTGASLRLTVAFEDRDIKEIEISFGNGHEPHRLIIPCADPFETLVIPLPGRLSAVTLRQLDGERPLWIFAKDASSSTPWFSPHAVVHSEGQMASPLDSFWERLCSLHSLASFGWKEGCVLEALRHLAALQAPEMKTDDQRGSKLPKLPCSVSARSALELHLRTYGFERGQLDYENPRGKAILDYYDGVEMTLPAATAASLAPDHHWVKAAIAFWKGTRTSVTAEGSLTMAYPMAVAGRALARKHLVQQATEELWLRKERLFHNGHFYLRSYNDGRRTFRNWSRGLAWYLLGLIKSLEEIGPEEAPHLLEEFQRAAAWTLSWQNAEGLWPCFIDEAGGLPDHAGCAGIAAAILMGCRAGWLDESARRAGSRSVRTLSSALTPDGLLPGCSQANKVGEELQRGSYRTAPSYALGLFALALLHSDED